MYLHQCGFPVKPYDLYTHTMPTSRILDRGNNAIKLNIRQVPREMILYATECNGQQNDCGSDSIEFRNFDNGICKNTQFAKSQSQVKFSKH